MKSRTTTRRYSQGARAEAAEATGERIAEAFLARLLKQWFDEITLDAVAEDAGVTVQTVIRRFGGKEGLLTSAVKVMEVKVGAQRAMPTGDVGRAVRGLLADYEQTGDGVIRMLALELRHPALKDVVNYGRSCHREWVSGVFVDWLGTLEPAARVKALDALVIAMDVYTWKLLRRDMGRSVAAAAATIEHMVRATMTEFSTVR